MPRRCFGEFCGLGHSFGASRPGLVGVELEFYQIAVRVPHVQGFPRSSGAYDVLRPAFDLHASVREAFGQHIFIETGRYKVIVGRPLAGEDGAAVVDERHYDRASKAFVLGLDVVNLSLKFYVGVESGNHFDRGEKVRGAGVV